MLAIADDSLQGYQPQVQHGAPASDDWNEWWNSDGWNKEDWTAGGWQKKGDGWKNKTQEEVLWKESSPDGKDRQQDTGSASFSSRCDRIPGCDPQLPPQDANNNV